jgi:hypothetical protein
MFGKQLGMNMDFMNQPEYKNADTATKYQFWNNGFFPNMGAMSNMMNTRARMGVQQAAPYARQQINNANIQAEEGSAGDYSYIE